MYKIGVIGDKQSILGFKAVGLEVFSVTNAEEAKAALGKMSADKFAIIYITERFIKDMEREVAEYAELKIPAIIPIPGMDGSYGIGIKNVKRSVEKAVGADILFGNS